MGCTSAKQQSKEQKQAQLPQKNVRMTMDTNPQRSKNQSRSLSPEKAADQKKDMFQSQRMSKLTLYDSQGKQSYTSMRREKSRQQIQEELGDMLGILKPTNEIIFETPQVETIQKNIEDFESLDLN